MITYLPPIYPDELLYSYLARIFEHNGFLTYKACAKEIYKNPKCHVDMEFFNAFNQDFLALLEETKPLKEYITANTLFPFYGRFLKFERRNKAFNSLLHQTNEYANLLTKQKGKGEQYLKYCPICAENDRKNHDHRLSRWFALRL